jgi:replicative DNA helicase
MNITLSVDEQVAQRAREAAQKMGKSLNQVVRDYLEQLAGSARRQQEWDEFERSCLASPGRLNGWKFDREEANARR